MITDLAVKRAISKNKGKGCVHHSTLVGVPKPDEKINNKTKSKQKKKVKKEQTLADFSSAYRRSQGKSVLV